jgi:hypothetical protein
MDNEIIARVDAVMSALPSLRLALFKLVPVFSLHDKLFLGEKTIVIPPEGPACVRAFHTVEDRPSKCYHNRNSV